jgi:hypothetical protein
MPFNVYRVYFRPENRPRPQSPFEIIAFGYKSITELKYALSAGAVMGTLVYTNRDHGDASRRVVTGMIPIVVSDAAVAELRACSIPITLNQGRALQEASV